jgi:hypothetical protein
VVNGSAVVNFGRQAVTRVICRNPANAAFALIALHGTAVVKNQFVQEATSRKASEPKGRTKTMKSVNRKVLLSLLGIAIATPFLVIAIVAGAQVTVIADSLQGELLVVALALGGIFASMGEGRISLRGEKALATQRRLDTKPDTNLHGASALTHGY